MVNDYNKMFPHIAGYEVIKEEVAQIIDILCNTEEYTKRGAHAPRGWFFYGPPGVGKTRIVQDMAEYLKYPIVEISLSDAIRKKMTIEEDIVAGFAEAKNLGKSILFIDELDKFAGYKKYEYEPAENLKTQKTFLHELDEIKNYPKVAVIATANNRDYLPDTILRSGRFDRQVKFPLPTKNDRIKILTLFIGDMKLAPDISISEMTNMTARCSCADIEAIVNEAKISVISKRADSISLEYFEGAFSRITSNDIPKDNTEQGEKLKLLAYHEAGHALMCYLYQPEKLGGITLMNLGSSTASVQRRLFDSAVQTKKDYEYEIMTLFGGLIAVYIMTGDYANGNSADWERVRKLVELMADEGFFGVKAMLHHPKTYTTYSVINFDTWYLSVSKQVNKLYHKTQRLLAKKKNILERIANALVEKVTLSRAETIEIIEDRK